MVTIRGRIMVDTSEKLGKIPAEHGKVRLPDGESIRQTGSSVNQRGANEFIMGTGRQPGQGTATWVQAVNDLPKAQASRRDEFAGVNRGSGHRAQSPRRLVVATFAPAGRLIVGRSFTACATTVITAARLSPRLVHRRWVAQARMAASSSCGIRAFSNRLLAALRLCVTPSVRVYRHLPAVGLPHRSCAQIMAWQSPPGSQG